MVSAFTIKFADKPGNYKRKTVASGWGGEQALHPETRLERAGVGNEEKAVLPGRGSERGLAGTKLLRG